jgi:hypothetical protein
MSLFRPLNSSESNLFTIRISIDNFNTLTNDENIVSNNSSYSSTNTYLTSPTYNVLPKDFYIKYVSSNNFLVNYGKTYTNIPNIIITPIYSSIPVFTRIVKTISTANLYFTSYDGTAVTPSTDGVNGLLGFDINIIGPVKIGITTGNSNKGWALDDGSSSEPTNLFTYLNVNLGASYNIDDSVIISKNLKLLNSDGNIKTYTASTSTLDYTQTTWLIDGSVALTNLIPVKGMIIFISSTGTNYSGSSYTSNPTITLGTNVFLNFGTNNTIEFTQRGDSIILYGTSSTNFIVINKTSTINLS